MHLRAGPIELRKDSFVFIDDFLNLLRQRCEVRLRLAIGRRYAGVVCARAVGVVGIAAVTSMSCGGEVGGSPATHSSESSDAPGRKTPSALR